MISCSQSLKGFLVSFILEAEFCQLNQFNSYTIQITNKASLKHCSDNSQRFWSLEYYVNDLNNLQYALEFQRCRRHATILPCNWRISLTWSDRLRSMCDTVWIPYAQNNLSIHLNFVVFLLWYIVFVICSLCKQTH